jgi:hypothetical protein
MTRYALLYTGDGKKPAADVKAIRALPGITIISEKDSRLMVVEGPKSIKTAVNRMPNWAADQEHTFTIDLPGPGNPAKPRKTK